MAENYVQGNKLYIAGRDFSSNWTAISLMVGRETIDWTKGSDTTRLMKPGLKTGAFECEGVTDFADDATDEKLAAFLDLSDAPIIIGFPGSTSGDIGTTGYAMNANAGDYSPMGQRIGERVNFSVSARSDSQIARGTFLHDGDTARTTTANGTAYNLGAVSATQRVFACIQCLSASAGDTLDVVIASDSVEAFSGTPETQITFAQISTTGAFEWVELTETITDTWWRPQWTIAGNGSESFNFVVFFAICNAS